MIKINRYLTILLMLVLCIVLGSCSFVQYIKYEKETTQELGFDEILEQRLERLNILSSLDICHEDKLSVYKSMILDAKNELSECESASQINEVYEKHIYGIIGIALNSNVDLESYREDEKDTVTEIIEKYLESIIAADTKDDINSLFRSFEVEIYGVKTDAEYYAEELTELKAELKSAFSRMPVYSEYESNEVNRIEALITEFETALDALDNKEEASALFDTYKALMLEIPTIKDLEIIQKNERINFWKDKFETFAQKHSLSIQDEISEMILEISDIATPRLINLSGADFLIEMSVRIGDEATDDLRESVAIYLQNIVVETDYREQQKTQIKNAVQNAISEISSVSGISSVTDIFYAAKDAILAIPTSDTLWAQEDAAFFDTLRELYGDNVLKVPEKMYEASNYEELAAIIDYYAFYQISNTAFLRDTFRVKLLYTYKTPQWEINEVYWYCELIRSAAGITGYIESTSSGNYFVITIIPYAISTNTNATEGPIETDRYESLIDYKQSPDTQYTPRSDDFDDFAYLTKHTGKLGGIWNTQQLWYALEHGYLPEAVEDSAADKSLRRAKEILRQIISEGMSDEEKIFAIFTYFSRNVKFDDNYEKYLYPEDRDHFPDELSATLASFHVEGALFDNLAVCEGFAKAMLVMLRLEGIESYRIFIHGYSTNAINNLGHEGYGSHALVAIRMSDGNFYISDPYEAYQHNTRYPKLHQFLIPWNLHTTYVGSWSMIFTDFVYGKEMLPSIMDSLVYNGKSIFVKTKQELLDILGDFTSDQRSDVSISVFEYESRMTEALNTETTLTELGMTYHKVTYKDLTEYIIYKD